MKRLFLLFVLSILLTSSFLSSAVFDGKTSGVEIPVDISEKLEGASGVTFSLWFKRNPKGLNKRSEMLSLSIVATYTKVGIGFLSDNTIQFGGATELLEIFKNVRTVNKWTDTKWHHLVGVLDLNKKEAHIYVDGVLQEVTGDIKNIKSSVFPKRAGERNTIGVDVGLKYYFLGELKGVAIYKRALTESEINLLNVIGENITESEIESSIFLWRGDVEPSLSTAVKKEEEIEKILKTPILDEVKMIEFSGSSQELGKLWGGITKDIIQRSVANYIKSAEKNKISLEQLEKIAQPNKDILKEIAPHWIEERRARAEAAGVSPDIYLHFTLNSGFIGAQPRGAKWNLDLIEHECTSYAVSGESAENNGTFYHKTRDNTPSIQRGYIMIKNTPGVYKYIQAGSIAVNEKGLALSSDFGGPRPKTPKYRVRANLLNYILEKAENCEEALAILQNFVEKGWLTGGRIGQRWTLVDRFGNILDVTNSSDKGSVEFQFIKGKPHITRPSAQRLLETKTPISFLTFHDVGRDTLVKASISGMSVDIHPEYPEYLTIVWICFPARSVPFPLFMGGKKTPLALFDGTVNDVGINTNLPPDKLRKLEKVLYEEGKKFQNQLYKMIKEGKEKEVSDVIDEWVKNYTKRHLKTLGAMK
ncbi:carcinine hydrolase/isopenicillin-N N-acyltransferase family protein [bacterium]|nr:carcinine hydrolase/isopenicillin-N N-acyltransferase family protein [bacterium]